MLTCNQIKEEISIAYIHALAAKVGFACEKPSIDMDSIDVVVQENGLIDATSSIYSPEIKMQLKSSSAIVPQDGQLHFSLSIKNYNDLRAKSTSPRLLVLLILPEELHDCVSHSVDNLVIKKCAYWYNLSGLPETTNTSNITIQIPETNVLSPETLKDLMLRASKEEL